MVKSKIVTILVGFGEAMNVKLIPASEIKTGMYIDGGDGWYQVTRAVHHSRITLHYRMGTERRRAWRSVDPVAHVLVGVPDPKPDEYGQYE